MVDALSELLQCSLQGPSLTQRDDSACQYHICLSIQYRTVPLLTHSSVRMYSVPVRNVQYLPYGVCM